MSDPTRPPNAPAQLWLVQYANGERHFVDRPLDGDMRKWAAQQKGVTVFGYDFRAVVYHAPLPKEPKP
jgi:hypothetical protein